MRRQCVPACPCFQYCSRSSAQESVRRVRESGGAAAKLHLRSIFIRHPCPIVATPPPAHSYVCLFLCNPRPVFSTHSCPALHILWLHSFLPFLLAVALKSFPSTPACSCPLPPRPPSKHLPETYKDDTCGVRTHALSDWRLKPAP